MTDQEKVKVLEEALETVKTNLEKTLKSGRQMGITATINYITETLKATK